MASHSIPATCLTFHFRPLMFRALVDFSTLRSEKLLSKRQCQPAGTHTRKSVPSLQDSHSPNHSNSDFLESAITRTFLITFWRQSAEPLVNLNSQPCGKSRQGSNSGITNPESLFKICVYTHTHTPGFRKKQDSNNKTFPLA